MFQVCLGLMALAGFGGTNAILFYATALFESASKSVTVATKNNRKLKFITY